MHAPSFKYPLFTGEPKYAYHVTSLTISRPYYRGQYMQMRCFAYEIPSLICKLESDISLWLRTNIIMQWPSF